MNKENCKEWQRRSEKACEGIFKIDVMTITALEIIEQCDDHREDRKSEGKERTSGDTNTYEEATEAEITK